MEADRKRSRRLALQDLLHVGGVSVSGLANILSRVGPDKSCINLLRDVNLDRFRALHTVLHVTLRDGELFAWEIIDLSKALPAYLAHSAGLRQLYAEAAARSPPTLARPWSAVVAFDEFVPGNKLQAFGQLAPRVLAAWRPRRFDDCFSGSAAS